MTMKQARRHHRRHFTSIQHPATESSPPKYRYSHITLKQWMREAGITAHSPKVLRILGGVS